MKDGNRGLASTPSTQQSTAASHLGVTFGVAVGARAGNNRDCIPADSRERRGQLGNSGLIMDRVDSIRDYMSFAGAKLCRAGTHMLPLEGANVYASSGHLVVRWISCRL